MKTLAIESVDDGFPSGFCFVIFFPYNRTPLQHKQPMDFYRLGTVGTRKLVRARTKSSLPSLFYLFLVSANCRPRPAIEVRLIKVMVCYSVPCMCTFLALLLPQTSPSFLH